MQSNQKHLNKFVNILLVFALIIALLGLGIDIRNTFKFGGIDLRNRVVGARLLTKGLDPYHFKWTPGDDQRLLDPLDWPTIPVTRTTVNPSVLLFHSLFANLPYFPQRIIWFVIQWFCLIASIFIFLKNNLHDLRTKSILISILIFICGSSIWRVHVDVGQFYIILVFLLALAYQFFSSSKMKYGNALGGFCIGLAACFRFPLIIMVLPMIIFKKVKMLTATLLSFFFCLVVSVLFTGLPAWQNYVSAMATNGKLNIESLKVDGVDVKKIFPKIVEGMNNLQDFNGGIPNSNSSLQFFLKESLSLQIESKYFVIIIATILLIYSFIIYQYRNNSNNKTNIKEIDLFFFIGMINVLIVDYLIPAPRHVYNNVFYLIPLILLLKNINPFNTQMLSCTMLMFIGFLTLNGMFAWLPNEIQVGEFIMLGSMILMSIIFIKGSIPILPKKL